jgi:hypothetical protein
MIYDQITTTPTIYDSRFTIRSPVTPTTTYDHDHDYDSRFSFQWKHPKRNQCAKKKVKVKKNLKKDNEGDNKRRKSYGRKPKGNQHHLTDIGN